MRLIRRMVVFAGLAAASGGAWATLCADALSDYFGFPEGSPSRTLLLSNHPECFPGSWGNIITQINGTSFEHATAISRAVTNRWFSDAPGPRAGLGPTGMAAGGAAKRWSFWGNVSSNDTRQNYTTIVGNTSRSEMDVRNYVFGADWLYRPGLVFGVSLGIDRGSGQGTNSGSGDLNDQDTDGYTVAPYLGWQISKTLSFDASAGYGTGELRSSGGGLNSTAQSDRWFAAANLNYETWRGNWQFSGKASLLHGVEKYEDSVTTFQPEAGTAAKNTLDQLRLGVQAGYWMNGFMPYASLGYMNDFTRKTTQDAMPGDPFGKSAWFWSVGVNFFSLAGGINGGIAYKQEESRDNQKHRNLVLNIGFRY